MSCDPIALHAKLNLAENEVQQAMRAAKKSDFVKVWADIAEAKALLDQAKAMCHDDVPHEHPAPTPTPTPSPTPTDPPHEHPEPEPAGDVLASSVQPVPTTFDKAPWIAPASQHTTGENAPDKGAFRLTGNISHLNYDDSIVFPRLPGAAHLHMYWGNTRSDAFSTYESLRSGGNGTTEGGPLLRSTYWMPPPLLLDTIKLPDYITMYYKRAAQMGDPMPVGVQALASVPRGLRMITRAGKFVLRKLDKTVIESNVGKPTPGTPLPELLAQVAPGDTFQIILDFPDAWDGERIETADHMSHMAHVTQRDKNTGKLLMPAAHPVLIPHIQEILTFTAQEGEDWTQFQLASDRAMSAPAGSTLHGDFIEAHDDEIREEWTANAIERRLNCSGGDMGSGRKLVRPPSFTFKQGNRIPLSAVPVGGEYRLID